MKISSKFYLLIFFVITGSLAENYQDFSDNEFAEFEDFDIEEEQITNDENSKLPKEASNEEKFSISEEDDDQDIIVDDENDSEFAHFQDVEEFEGFDEKDEKPASEPKITIANVPVNFRQNWDSYYLEILMMSGLIVYFINFATGKSKNTKIANLWFHTHRQILEDNFSLVGDDGSDKNENINLVKESENIFTLWCSGRVCCEGMLVELKLIKRQDLVAVLANMMRPAIDQVHITVKMNKEDMDSFVFCAATKKTAQHLVKDMNDLSVFCPERKIGEKFGLAANFNVMSEISEATSAMLDSKVVAMLNKYPEYIDFIHFSDQYSGSKVTEDSGTLKLPETEKVLIFGFNIPLKGVPLEEAVQRLKPLMSMVFYCVDKVKRFRMSKEAKSKAEKNRQKVEEAFLKSTHQARAEAAAARREEKRRLEKEKVMAEDDPERQRRWEIREEKRQAKKRGPKMKQLKVKAL